MLARDALEKFLALRPRIANLTLAQAALQLGVSGEIADQINASPYKDLTLIQIIKKLATRDGALIFQSEIISSSLGQVSLSQIAKRLLEVLPNFSIPEALKPFGAYTLNDVAICQVA